MSNTKTNLIRCAVLTLVVLSAYAWGLKKAHAVLGVGDVDIVTVVGNTSPTEIENTTNTDLQYMKSFILDKLATTIAKQILQQMTASVVNWINHGFQGSPSFLTNPEGFFRNAGDQASGAFLAGNGDLAGLCGNIGANIRATLGLQAANKVNPYTCTLSKVITNFQNLPNNITLNGMSINGFMNGDFSQGGWPAFIALTTQPQNNAYGGYVMAQSDLQYNVALAQGKVQADVNLGHGFMSWQSCSPIPGATSINPGLSPVSSSVTGTGNAIQNFGTGGATLGSGITSNQSVTGSNSDLTADAGLSLQQSPSDSNSDTPNLSTAPNLSLNSNTTVPADNTVNTNAPSSVDTSSYQIANPGPLQAGIPQQTSALDATLVTAAYPDSKVVNNADGTVTYENCTTQTPGSVISSQLTQQLGVPANELLLANDINAVINALVTQLVSTLMKGGLNNLSNGSNSYTSQLSQNAAKQSSAPLSGIALTKAIAKLQDNKDSYDQAIADVNGSIADFQGAQACFTALLGPPTTLTPYQQNAAEIDINSIEATLANDVQPYLDGLTQKDADASSTLEEAQSLTTNAFDFSAPASASDSIGTISGTPTATGTASFSIQVTGANPSNQPAIEDYTLFVDSPATSTVADGTVYNGPDSTSAATTISITTPTLLDAVVGEPYSQTIFATTSDPTDLPFAAEISGNLPNGLSFLSSDQASTQNELSQESTYIQTVQSAIQNSYDQSKSDQATADLTDAKKQADQFNKQADTFEAACKALPATIAP